MMRIDINTARLLALASYGGILLFSLISIIVGFAKFDVKDYVIPTPPVPTTLAPNATTPHPYYIYDEKDKYDTLRKQLRFHTKSPHFYLVMPNLITIILSCVIVVLEVAFKNVFTTTLGVYMSFQLWLSHLIFMMMYFETPYLYDEMAQFFFSAVPAVAILHGFILVLLMVQMGLLGWYLMKQDVGWPCFKLGHFFTFETLFVIPRFIFTIILASSYFEHHAFIRGILGSCYSYSTSPCKEHHVPESLSYTVGVFFFFSVMISGEAMLSTYFGVIHRVKSAVLGLVSSGCVLIGVVLSSESFVKYHFENSEFYDPLVGFGTTCFVFTVLHSILSLIASKKISSPPNCITILGKKQTPEATEQVLANGYGRLVATTGGINHPQHMTTITLRINLFVFLIAVLNLILISVERYGSCAWGENILLSMNIVMGIRCLTFLLTYKITGVTIPQPAVTVVLQFLMESVPMFIGAFAVFFTMGYHLILIAPALFSILIVIFQGVVLTRNSTGLGGFVPQDKTQLIQEDEASSGAGLSESRINLTSS